MHPQAPYICRRKFWDLHEDREIHRPLVGALPTREHDLHPAYLPADVGMPGVRFSDDDIRRAILACFGPTSQVISLVVFVFSALRSTGVEKDKAILFEFDHGEPQGGRGMWFKNHFFDKSLRVPLFLFAP